MSSRRFIEPQKTYKTSKDLQNFKRLYGVTFVKMSFCFLFGHKGLVVILLAFWITFAFDSSWSILLGLKSSFESYLAISPRLYLYYVYYLSNF